MNARGELRQGLEGYGRGLRGCVVVSSETVKPATRTPTEMTPNEMDAFFLYVSKNDKGVARGPAVGTWPLNLRTAPVARLTCWVFLL